MAMQELHYKKIIKTLLNSMYTRFIIMFLGAFFFSIIAAFILVSVTQVKSIQNTVYDAIENRAKNVRAMVDEKNVTLDEAVIYLSTEDVNISVVNQIDNSNNALTAQQITGIENGETIILFLPHDKALIKAFSKVQGRYIVITPDLQNSPINQILVLQRLTLTIPAFLGTLLIVLAVTMVTKPIKDISEASKQVAAGNFEIKVKVRGNHEIADLSRNFNLMVKELSSNEYLHKNFVSDVSHEFKTPITSLIGYAKLIKNNELTREQRDEYADIIISESLRLSNLSTNLLKLSELESEVIHHKKEQFSLSEQIRGTIVLLQNQWENKNLELDIDMDEVSFYGDKDLLYQVWVNIISNAITYSNDGGILKISLKKDDKIRVSIIDNGIGMSKEDLDKIFTRFYKADKSRSSSGTGLGLSIARKIIEINGGTITAESQPGKGSRFDIVFYN
jgi:signal transduction histidine kinase